MEVRDFLDAGEAVDEKETEHIRSFVSSGVKTVAFQVADPEIRNFFRFNGFVGTKNQYKQTQKHKAWDDRFSHLNSSRY